MSLNKRRALRPMRKRRKRSDWFQRKSSVRQFRTANDVPFARTRTPANAWMLRIMSLAVRCSFRRYRTRIVLAVLAVAVAVISQSSSGSGTARTRGAKRARTINDSVFDRRRTFCGNNIGNSAGKNQPANFGANGIGTARSVSGRFQYLRQLARRRMHLNLVTGCNQIENCGLASCKWRHLKTFEKEYRASNCGKVAEQLRH